MRLFYADPGLINNTGHHASVCHGFLAQAKALGVETVVLANTVVELEAVGALSPIPTFRVSPYALTDGDPLCGWLYPFLRGAEIAKADFAGMPSIGTDDILYVTSCQPAHIFGLFQWIETLAPAQMPSVVVDLVFWPGLDKTMEGGKAVWKDRDPRRDARGAFYRYVGRYAKARNFQRLHIVTTHTDVREVYALLLLRDVTLITSVHQHSPPKLVDCLGRRPITVATVGHQRVPKGYHLMPDVFRELLRMRSDVQILVHNSDVSTMPQIHNAVRDIAKENGPRVVVDERSLSLVAYQALLDSIDLMICAYDPAIYRSMPSGVVLEWFANGIPVVVPADTVLADQLKFYGGSGATFDAFTSAAILAATNRALDGLDQHAATALAAAKQWATQNDKFVKTVLEVAAT